MIILQLPAFSVDVAGSFQLDAEQFFDGGYGYLRRFRLRLYVDGRFIAMRRDGFGYRLPLFILVELFHSLPVSVPRVRA